MCDTRVADARLSREDAAVGGRLLGEWMDCHLSLRSGLLTLVSRLLKSRAHVVHTCCGEGADVSKAARPCDAGSLDVGVVEYRGTLASKHWLTNEWRAHHRALPWTSANMAPDIRKSR